MMVWLFYADATEDDLGLIPHFLSDDDPRPAVEQFHERYAHGGGWRPFGDNQWQLGDRFGLKFPGDPWLRPIAMTRLRDELIVVYEHAMVAVFHSTGDYEVARLD